ncbi:MAG: hypothetical protein HFG80_10525 [Eubacterium sp.]|nr:hypothetical protein [Eubacterium sp.]
MIKEALQYIIGIQQPRIEEINGQKYYFTSNGIPSLVGECRRCEALEISTLTSLVDYIKGSLADDFAAPGVVPKMIIHVESETEVNLVSVFNGDMGRWTIANVRARIPQIALNKFIGQEQFIIQMQSMFIDNMDKAVVLQVAGNVEDKTVANYGDDGVSQKATIKTGLANVEDVIVPNPVKLQPFRTFHEIEQPEIDFIFRMRNGADGVACALFEADGGAWKFRAVHSIAEYLKEELKDVENIAVLS